MRAARCARMCAEESMCLAMDVISQATPAQCTSATVAESEDNPSGLFPPACPTRIQRGIHRSAVRHVAGVKDLARSATLRFYAPAARM